MSIARHHAEWLSLLEISGPFVSMPVLLRVFPQGLDAHDADHIRELRLAYEEWQDNQLGLRPDPAIHAAWVRYVLENTLGMPAKLLVEGSGIPADLELVKPEQGETVRPDLAVLDPDTGTPRLLVQVYAPGQKLERYLPGSHWKASPDTRMAELLRAAGVRLGLVTNGERWMLVDAPRDGTTGYISWYTHLWLEEPVTLRAFRTLLGVRRFFGVQEEETLEAMLADSASEQQDVTDQLGYQVRRAVEVLVQAIDLADRDRGGVLLRDVSEARLYEAALTVMMRLVFLFYAEENELLPLSDEFYGGYYALSPLGAQLRETADRTGEEVLERRQDAWARLLATFRAIHGGVSHDRMRLPTYDSSLFDPDRFPFLEGRPEGTQWQTTPADPLPIDNRTVLHLLEALQWLEVKAPGGGPAEARRLSFRALGIEQIGHVYEGLLDHTAVRAETPVLGLYGTKDREPEVPLTELERLAPHNPPVDGRKLLDYLHDQTGRSESALRRALESEPDPAMAGPLRAACGNDDALYVRVLPWAGLVRPDSFGHPVVIPAGSVYVTAGTERRATGTHYTPRSLTEPIVQHTLEPLVYDGPKEGLPREQWALKPPEAILDLKVCDMAMGSGAFLVQACRYLSERLVESLENLTNHEEHEGHKGKRKKNLRALRGLRGSPLEPLIAATDLDERLTLARRLVADRCLYGVDKNPLAVEMAKLSLWLITLDKTRPFTFLDHALKCGDSLVGVSLDQLRHWSLDTEGTPEIFAEGLRGEIDAVVALRREISALPVNTPDDQRHKAHLLARAEAMTHNLRTAADHLVGSYWNDLPNAERERVRHALFEAFNRGTDVPEDVAEVARTGTVAPFHWEIEFPEVFLDGRSGFDAFMSNPPFMGGQTIRGRLGGDYLSYLKTRWDHAPGSADYCSYFFLRGFEQVATGGTIGFIATNTIAQGDTRALGLEYIGDHGGEIFHVVNNQPWPGTAAVVVDIVHIHNGAYGGERVLDSQTVEIITPMLDDMQVRGNPYRLVVNEGRSFQGSITLGLGFIMSQEEAQFLIDKDARNAEVLFPYLNGEDLNGSPDQSPSRWVINFFDWPLEQAEQYPDCMAIVREKVYPQRMQQRDKFGRDYWWRFLRPRPELYNTIAPLRRVLVIARVSKTGAFVFVPRGSVFNEKTVIFPFECEEYFAMLQSSFHGVWIWKYSSTLKSDLNYAPSDCFDTFPLPTIDDRLRPIGETYHEHRRQIMLDRQEGLTKTYNRFHEPEETSADIVRLRELHVEMDRAVATGYGWDDLDLGHGFHETAQGVRFTISEPARREVLDRLLLLNHERYAAEVKAGLHEKKGKGKGKGKKKGGAGQMGLL